MKQLKAILVVLPVLLAIGSCGGNGTEPRPPAGEPPQLAQPVDGESLDGLLLRDVSGKVTGIQINWEPVADLGAEKIVGYHIYQAAAEITDAQRGDSSLWLADDAFLADADSNKTVFPQDSPTNGGKFSYVKPASVEFPLNIGESWHYRISALNDSGEESGLSPELVVDVGQHSITNLSSVKLPVGAELTIKGKNFGQYDLATDSVVMVGNEWNAVDHVFETVDLEPVITDWQPSAIKVEVPAGATKGRVKVLIDGISSQSFDLFENADPYITDITPYERFLNQTYKLSGGNFGSAQDATHFVVVNGTDQDDASKYNVYSDNTITFALLPGTQFGESPLAVSAGGKQSNTGFLSLKNQAPVAAFSMNKTSGKVPVQVNFNAAGSSDLEGDLVSWTFDWGDGSAPETKLAGDTPSFSHIFEKAGPHDVVLTVEDGEGLTGTILKVVTGLPAAEVLLVEDIDNGQGVGNNYIPNVQAIRQDIGAAPDGLALDAISGGYSVGIGQVAIDSGVRVVIWFRGGPGSGDPIQDWPRNWSTDEKNDLLAILNAGIDVLLISQNHQFTGDDTSADDFSALYGLNLQNDTVVESGGTRPFSWMFGCPTDITYTHMGDELPSSPVCLKGTFPAGVLTPGAAELYNGQGSSGNIPTGLTLVNNRIQSGLVVDPALIGSSINSNFQLGAVADENTYPFKLCYSYGLTTAPDSGIGFSGGGYSHNGGTAKLYVVGWSWSEITIAPGSVSRADLLQNMLAWLDPNLTLP